MTDETKSKISSAVDATKKSFWKYLGAMMMEPKGPDGEQAVSYTRVLGVVLFVCCLVIWITKTFVAGEVAPGPDGTVVPVIGDVPDGMLYTLWGLIGIKGAKDVAVGLKGNGG
jgi:hypothetical protein